MIQFLHPVFLYGLLFLAIPIVLHLFSFKKYKKVYFSNFNFLEALQQQKKNSSRLKNWLLLLLRLLVIACLVIAFSAPYINPKHSPVSPANRPQVILYADNSFSMTNTGSQGNLFDEAKKHLFDIVNTYPTGTNFRLLSNDPANDALLTKEQTQTLLSSLRVSPTSKNLSQIFKEAKELAAGQAATLFLVSDFQKKNCDFQNILSDSLQETVLLLLKPENLNNIYINNVSFDQPFHKKDQHEKLTISVVNSSGRDFHNIPLSLTINGKKKSINQIDIPAHGEKKIEISYANSEDGYYRGQLEITDFPILFDNKFYFSYGIGGSVRVLYIWQEKQNPYFGKLFSDSTIFNFTTAPANQTTNLALSRYNLVILDGIAKSSTGLENMWEEYLINGGNLFILPGTNPTDNQNRFLTRIQAPQFGKQDTTTVISRIETQASLFRDVFAKEDSRAVLPRIHYFYPLSLPAHSEKLLEDKRNQTLLASRIFGKGNIYVSAFNFSPDNSDMVYHPLFVPLIVNMACNINSTLNNAYFLNSGKEVTISNREYTENTPLKIRREDQTFEFIPELRKNFSGDLILTNTEHVPDAGLYDVIQEEKVIDVLAWNYDRYESQMEFSNEEELSKYFPQARVENIRTTRLDLNSELIKGIVLQDNNKYLSPWFLLLAVIALFLEQWVWRRKLN